MKIVSWNCNMAFRNKYSQVMFFDPDILIIQECESDKVMIHKGFKLEYNNYIWEGVNQNKGIGVISVNDTQIKLNQCYNNKYKYILPVDVVQSELEITILCVWTQFVEKSSTSYIHQIYEAVKFYSEVLDTKKLFIIGDFNSSVIWDGQFKRTATHRGLVSTLSEIGIHSEYHEFMSEEQGEETIPTLYFRKKAEVKYHIDYIFSPRKLVANSSLFIGDREDYIKYSDHMPLFYSFEPNQLNNK